MDKTHSLGNVHVVRSIGVFVCVHVKWVRSWIMPRFVEIAGVNTPTPTPKIVVGGQRDRKFASAHHVGQAPCSKRPPSFLLVPFPLALLATTVPTAEKEWLRFKALGWHTPAIVSYDHCPKIRASNAPLWHTTMARVLPWSKVGPKCAFQKSILSEPVKRGVPSMGTYSCQPEQVADKGWTRGGQGADKGRTRGGQGGCKKLQQNWRNIAREHAT